MTTKLKFLAPNIIAIEDADGNFQGVAEMVSADSLHRQIGRTIVGAVNANAALLDCLTLVLKGLRNGSIRSKPIITGMDDPKATEYGLKSLEEIIGDEILKCSIPASK